MNSGPAEPALVEARHVERPLLTREFHNLRNVLRKIIQVTRQGSGVHCRIAALDRNYADAMTALAKESSAFDSHGDGGFGALGGR